MFGSGGQPSLLRCLVSSINGVAIGADQFKRSPWRSSWAALHYYNNLIISAINLNNNECFQLVIRFLDEWRWSWGSFFFNWIIGTITQEPNFYRLKKKKDNLKSLINSSHSIRKEFFKSACSNHIEAETLLIKCG